MLLLFVLDVSSSFIFSSFFSLRDLLLPTSVSDVTILLCMLSLISDEAGKRADDERGEREVRRVDPQAASVLSVLSLAEKKHTLMDVRTRSKYSLRYKEVWRIPSKSKQGRVSVQGSSALSFLSPPSLPRLLTTSLLRIRISLILLLRLRSSGDDPIPEQRQGSREVEGPPAARK